MKLFIICSIAAVVAIVSANYDGQNLPVGPVVNVPYGSNQFDVQPVGYQQNVDVANYPPIIQDYNDNYNQFQPNVYQQQVPVQGYGGYESNSYGNSNDNVNQYNSQDNLNYGQIGYPSYNNKNRVFVSRQGPPVIVRQPNVPIINVNSGPASVVRSNPVYFTQSPGYVIREETVNKQPSPICKSPVYVKVFKPQSYDNYGSNSIPVQGYGNSNPIQSY